MILKLIILIIPAIFHIRMAEIFFRYKYLNQNGSEAFTEIIAINCKHNYEENNISIQHYYITLKYNYNDKEYIIRVKEYFDTKYYKNQTVRIFYNANCPEEIVINDSNFFI
ncbi:MAG: hypothetical protein K2G63_02055 [Oscillospiraceae bacterium]|nr:hypothetical protein [Oscillospiraceae bacterium]